ncbi:hypothetical protein FQR65_LT14262 [Abscondita terminalis]|nr:hypothetical protein FQR65_LT14262 [Abscondita terminalis]
MIVSRFVNNSGAVSNIFRRLSVSSSDLRISSTCNLPICKASVCCHKFTNAAFRNRSFSAGQQIAAIRNMSGASASKHKNRLALEKSPYLLQHATNPVDWYPWGEEAFDKARKENKLIFLSVGYSTCHWCHVMEKESFESDSVAEVMNKHFVNIKVDREERPDVDRLYMSFIQASTGSGGWPMSVFLTPNLEPLAGGTYFPPEDMFGRPGFKTVLKNIAEQWRTKQTAIANSGKHTLEVLKKVSEREISASQQIEVPSIDCGTKCLQQLTRSYESEYGGFSRAPKFPQPSNFNFLFHMYVKSKESEQGKHVLEMCLHTLRRMAYGGIHDHVNCGFARYSVDNKWHVPHFEKMLYDQGQLVVSYCDAYVVTKDTFYSDVVKDILTYVSRDLSHPLGGFYGAEDADSYAFEGAKHKEEGAFCVWDYKEIEQLIKDAKERDIFCHHYNVRPDGNVNPAQDPHGELTHKNVLTVSGSFQMTADAFGITVASLKEMLERHHQILYETRQKRPKPHVDTKIVTAWNGLMISGFARAGFVLKDQNYINKAILAANFIKKYLYSEEEKTLTRCCYKGEDGGISQISVPILGFLDDYAFLIRGLLDLYEASLDSDWLQWAETLQEQQDRQFWDGQGFGYFTSPEGDASILIRGKEDQDGAEPCGNSVSVHNLLRLAAYLDRQDLRAKAGRTLTAFSEKLSSIPVALPEMTSALLFYHDSPTQVFIAGEREDNNTQALLDVVRSSLLPGRILALADGPTGQAGLLYRRHESLARLHPVHGKSAAYVCRNFACSLPVTEPDELATSLDTYWKDKNKMAASQSHH